MMSSQLSEFNKSGTRVNRPGRGLLRAILLAALPMIVVVAMMIVGGRANDGAVEPPAREFLVVDPESMAPAGLADLQAREVANAIIAITNSRQPADPTSFNQPSDHEFSMVDPESMAPASLADWQARELAREQ